MRPHASTESSFSEHGFSCPPAHFSLQPAQIFQSVSKWGQTLACASHDTCAMADRGIRLFQCTAANGVNLRKYKQLSKRWLRDLTVSRRTKFFSSSPPAVSSCGAQQTAESIVRYHNFASCHCHLLIKDDMKLYFVIPTKSKNKNDTAYGGDS